MISEAKKRLLARKVQEVLREDILNRYDNIEYYNFDLDAVADVLIDLSEEDRQAVLSIVR